MTLTPRNRVRSNPAFRADGGPPAFSCRPLRGRPDPRPARAAAGSQGSKGHRAVSGESEASLARAPGGVNANPGGRRAIRRTRSHSEISPEGGDVFIQKDAAVQARAPVPTGASRCARGLRLHRAPTPGRGAVCSAGPSPPPERDVRRTRLLPGARGLPRGSALSAGAQSVRSPLRDGCRPAPSTAIKSERNARGERRGPAPRAALGALPRGPASAALGSSSRPAAPASPLSRPRPRAPVAVPAAPGPAGR